MVEQTIEQTSNETGSSTCVEMLLRAEAFMTQATLYLDEIYEVQRGEIIEFKVN